jgi:hypothetical protein
MGQGPNGEKDFRPSYCKCGSDQKDIFLLYYIEEETIRRSKQRYSHRMLNWYSINLPTTACVACLGKKVAAWVDHKYDQPQPLMFVEPVEKEEKR